MVSRHSVAAALVLWGCASRSIEVGEQHPANARAPTTETWKPPPTLRADFDPHAQYARAMQRTSGSQDHAHMQHGGSATSAKQHGPDAAAHGDADAPSTRAAVDGGTDMGADAGTHAGKNRRSPERQQHGNH